MRPPTRTLGDRLALGALLLAACAGAHAKPPADEGPVRVLEQFLTAVERGDMDSAYALLSGRWRAYLTPARLGRDLQQGGEVAQDRLARARVAARGPPLVEGNVAAFPIGEGSAVRLLREQGGWRVDALE